VRRELTRRVIALDPAVDEAFGESAELRYYSPVLQTAVGGLFTALLGWRVVANHLVRMSDNEAQRAAAAVLEIVPRQLRSAPEHDQPTRWKADLIGLHRICATAAARLIALRAESPSLRLLGDQTANVLAGMMHVLNGLALLVADPTLPLPRSGRRHLRVPDWLPALVNGGRAFVAIGAVALFWIFTEWPSGASTLSFTAIIVLLLAPQADRAYLAGIVFLLGSLLNVVLTATIAFAALPGSDAETFAAFSLIIGVCLVPIGALLAHARRPWEIAMFTAMTITFMPLLAPTNQMVYNTVQFYNGTVAIIAGAGVAVLSFRLLPSLSSAYRTRRLLMLTLRDLRRLTTGRRPRTPEDWHDRMSGRLSALPDQAEPLQRSQLLAALSVGTEIVKLRRMDFGSELDAALAALRRGDIALAAARLSGLDDELAARPGAGALRARSGILAMSEALTQHAGYFAAGVSG
jgi:uncharacterized membrane protein YccC